MCINTTLRYCSVCIYEFSLYMKKVLRKDIFEHGINLLLFCYLFKFNIPLSRPTYPDSLIQTPHSQKMMKTEFQCSDTRHK